MRAVLDEGVPRDLAGMLREAGCDVTAFPNRWKGMKNGMLLAMVKEASFDCLLTCDKSMRYQQNIAAAGIAVVVLPTQQLDRLRKLVPDIALVVSNSSTGRTYLI